MSRHSSRQQQAVNPLAAPSVDGLQAGREAARRDQRRRRHRDSITSGLGVLLLVGVVTGAAYVGYTIFVEQEENERVESELRRSELQQERSGNNVLDAIDELEDQPKWNGPGNPSFGVSGG
jgi:hypothetical protein